MEKVSLSYFVDFVLKVGMPRLSGVKEFKEHRYDHLTDFYRPLREAIIEMHEKNKPLTVLDDLLGTLSDERKRRIFPELVGTYKQWLRPGMKWSTPPKTTLAVGDLTIEINPELSFEIDGKLHVIKTYFRGEPLSQKRVSLVLGLISSALGPVRPGTVFGMLDVKNGHLRTLKSVHNPKLGVLLRGEAASFSTIYASV